MRVQLTWCPLRLRLLALAKQGEAFLGLLCHIFVYLQMTGYFGLKGISGCKSGYMGIPEAGPVTVVSGITMPGPGSR